jgi:hypothetical protein
LRTGGLRFDGVDDYAKVEPFTVYGWSEITIAEWLYAVKPKANPTYSKPSMIGDSWLDFPSTFHVTDNLADYTTLSAKWYTRKPDGTVGAYSCSWISYVNQWVHIVRRFTANREFSVWINGVKVYSATVPATEKTILEWNPDTASRPIRYKRFVLAASTNLDEFMTCMVGKVCIYDRALTQAEIQNIYNGNFVKNGLVLCLDMSEYEGSILYDKSGYGNNGTIYGATWVIKKQGRVLPSSRVLAAAR